MLTAKMNTAIYSLVINQYDTMAGTNVLKSFKISVCSGAQTLAEVIKEKTDINPPNIHCVYAWFYREAEGKQVKFGVATDLPLATHKIVDNSTIGVYLFQESILPSLSNTSFCKWSRNNWRAKFEDDKIPAAILRTPPEAVKDLLSKLLPVHSCSVDTFIKIIQAGAVKARSRLMPRVQGEIPSVYKSLMEKFQSHFIEIMKDKKCPWNEATSISSCYNCIEKIINLAEVMIAAHRLGNTRVIQLRRARFELYFPAFTKGDFDQIEKVALSLASDTTTSSQTGIGYWVDEFLGTHEHVFAVMGPNVHYGPVSIIFKRTVCNNDQSKITLNSSTTMVSGHALSLRPWLKLAAKEFKATQYGGNVWTDSTFNESIAVDLTYFIHRTAHFGAAATRGELELLKKLQQKELYDFKSGFWLLQAQQEITSQAILAFMKDRSKYEVEDYISQYTIAQLNSNAIDRHNYSWEPKLDLISGSFPPDARKKDRPEDVTTQDIIDRYMNVDPHGRLEALLPPSVPLTDTTVFAIIIPRTVVTPQLTKLLRETKVGVKRAIDLVVFTENEEESLKWQQQYFSVLTD